MQFAVTILSFFFLLSSHIANPLCFIVMFTILALIWLSVICENSLMPFFFLLLYAHLFDWLHSWHMFRFFPFMPSYMYFCCLSFAGGRQCYTTIIRRTLFRVAMDCVSVFVFLVCSHIFLMRVFFSAGDALNKSLLIIAIVKWCSL